MSSIIIKVLLLLFTCFQYVTPVSAMNGHTIAFRDVPTPVMLIDNHFAIVDISTPYLVALNLDAENCVGKDVGDLVRSRLDVEQAAQLITAIMITFTTNDCRELEVRDRNRRHFWHVRVCPWRAASKSRRFVDRFKGQHYVTMQVVDLTHLVTQSSRMQLAAMSADIYHKIVSNIQDYAIFMLSPKGHVMSWNSGAAAMMQYEEEEIEGVHFSVFFREEDKANDEPNEELALTLTNQKRQFEGWRVRKDGSEFCCAISLQPLYNDDHSLIGFIKVTQDLTQRKQAEHALLEAHDQAASLKEQFLATASHEIRSPLTSVLGNIDVLLKTASEPTSANVLLSDQKEILSNIRQSGEFLSNFVNDLLDFFKGEAKAIKLASSRIHIRDMIEALADSFRKRTVVPIYTTISEDVPPVVVGDSSKLQQVITNLLANAIKFTHTGGITIAVHRRITSEIDLTRMRRKQKVSLLVSVSDTGIGLTDKQIGRLFIPFSQANKGIAERYGGTGLGLAICKQCVELMNGKIWVESEKGVGSTFKFTMDLEIATPSYDDNENVEANAQMTAVNLLAPCQIVIVDDNKSIRDVLSRIVKIGGMHSMTFNDGTEVVAYVESIVRENRRADPFIILMDIEMPIMSGHEATRLIHSMSPWARQIPIIGVTANAMKEDRQACLDAGMVGYLSKPFTIKQVLDQINQARIVSVESEIV